MKFHPFDLVHWQSMHESDVDYTLADSSCQPVALNEYLHPAEIEQLVAAPQHYGSVRGYGPLRERIGAWHGMPAEQILVTNGAAEANTLVIDALVTPDAHVVVMEPGYRQIRGCAVNAGATVSDFTLEADQAWRPDLGKLAELVRPDTELIAITNPNNPTGTVLSDQEMTAIVEIASRTGAWLLVDEVHRGTELDSDEVTPTFWGRYDRLVCTGSLSKAFALPGLRIGWVAAPPGLLGQLWRRHEYMTVAAGLTNMQVAEMALRPGTREWLLARNRTIMRSGRNLLQQWADDHDGLVSLVPPTATALAFVRYRQDLTSVEIADMIRVKARVLVIPGAYFGSEGHFRVIHSLEPNYVTAALDRIADVLA